MSGWRCFEAAFTLVELLVVIAIIGVLTAIIMPNLSRSLRSARAVKSLSNLRSWNTALRMYLMTSNDQLPWDGVDSVATSIQTADWWANVLPPYVDSDAYSNLVARNEIPVPPSRSIFIDPSAKAPPGAPYQQGAVKFFFCYVPNSKLNSGLSSSTRLSLHHIARPAVTVFMVEMRTIRDELPPTHPFYNKTLDRAKADWQRFANRHNQGGHLAFLDGHARHETTEKVTTPIENDYNKPDIVWNPFGVAN